MPTDTLTARLRLSPCSPADAEELFPVFSDPAGWWYDPAGRHVDLDRTRDWLRRAAARWDTDGLSYWTVRERDGGAAVGVGGVQRQSTGVWNVDYRIAADRQGRGYAVELGRAALAAAAARDADAPVVAWVAAVNTPSRRVAARLGLVDRGEAVDASDGERRHAYTDRVFPLPDLRPDAG